MIQIEFRVQLLQCINPSNSTINACVLGIRDAITIFILRINFPFFSIVSIPLTPAIFDQIKKIRMETTTKLMTIKAGDDDDELQWHGICIALYNAVEKSAVKSEKSIRSKRMITRSSRDTM